MLRRTVASVVALAAAGTALLAVYGTAEASPAQRSAGGGAVVQFAGAKGFERISGAEGTCQAVTPMAAVALRSVTGTLTLWSGAGCDSGKSWVVSGNVSDLSVIGFDRQLTSVFVGDDDPDPLSSGAIFDDDARFSAEDGVQNVSGDPGTCQDLARVDVTSSVFVAGGRMTLFSGTDCTGRSVVIDGDVSDLAAIGFDNRAASVFLG
jgi:hypothetical protein